MSLSLNRRHLIWLAAGLLGLLALVIVVLNKNGGATIQTGPSAEQAAVRATQAFYAVDYRNQAGWLAGLKPISTDKGYRLIESLYATSAWPALQSAQTIVAPEQVKAEVLRTHSEGQGGTGNWKIIVLQTALDPAALWPSMKSSTFTVNVLVVEEASGWKFEAFLSDADAQKFAGK